MRDLFKRISEVNPTTNACLEVLEKSALENAAAVDAKVAKGEPLRLLEGLPLLVKANIDVAGTLSSASTPALKDWKPSITAPCAQKLLDAGAIVIAKTHMPEFAMRMDGWNDTFGMIRNPHSLEHSPGGSSSGTASAIASGMGPVGLGSDTAGSLRLPAASCGIAGFRPSRGRWPVGGVIPIDATKDTPGPMGGCVSDLALLDAVVTGEDPVEPADLKGARFVVPRDWLADVGSLDSAVTKALEQAINVLTKAGAVVEDKNDFLPIVNMKYAGMAMDGANEMQQYLDSHADLPKEVTVAKIVELSTSHGKVVFLPHKDPEAAKAKLAELYAAMEKQESAYREYFKENSVQAVLVPPFCSEPYIQKQEEAPDLMTNFGVSKIAGNFVQIRVPSLSLPTTEKHALGDGSLFASVMLYGVDDRQLLSIGLALEEAFLTP
eukprot:gnl/MRDRNA2_/MRDRNA2_151538_c0_seq1.p1 gnl/MRDRNA2_/MRDRNA2_151538_c0~~gnl/MRDRNA2_/MRDRNA2_151538_c0_seq1.p1  ORF type:complete len:497 (-),score=104.18 gnl/MRDRNA2_/MRDRNA2_151538_c0_seq1:51-1358(-)